MVLIISVIVPYNLPKGLLALGCHAVCGSRVVFDVYDSMSLLNKLEAEK